MSDRPMRELLADMLALAIVTHGPTSGSALARRVGVRKDVALRELRTNRGFACIGRGRSSRWRLAREPQTGAWEPLGTELGEGLGLDALDRLDALERRVAALERQLVETEAPPT
jgi:hypothetical protein